MIRFACPNCDKVYSVPDTAGGKAATCKQCDTRFQIPSAPAPNYEVVDDGPVDFGYEVVDDGPLAAPTPVPPPPPLQPPPPPLPPPPPPPPPPEPPPPPPAVPAIPELEPLDPNEPLPPPPPPPSPFGFVLSPPPPPDPVPGTVELQPCPTCGAKLIVRAEDVGAQVECSICKTVFVGQIAPAVPPPPPPPEEVDIAPCPQCRSELTVLPEDLGKDVECPHCQTVYKAQLPQAKAGTILARSTRKPDTPPLAPAASARKPYEFKAGAKKKDDSPADDDDRPKRKSSRAEEDDEDRPSQRKKKRRRRRRDEDDDLDDERYRSFAAHDGVLNLILSIVAFLVNWTGLCCVCSYAVPPILSIYVLIKASMSIGEIKKGLMDPSGRGLLETARVIALIALLLTIAGVVFEILVRMGVITLGFLGNSPFDGGPYDGGPDPDDDF